MKATWNKIKLGEILKLEYGKPLSDEKRKPDGEFPIYGANGIKGRTNEFYYGKKTIVVGRKGSAGEINITEEKFWPLDVTYFVTFDEKKYDLHFIYLLLSRLELPKLAKGVKPGINRNEVYAIEVKVPPLSEQQRIVAILLDSFTDIDKVKQNTVKKLNYLEELKKSILQKAFSGGLSESRIEQIKE